MRPPTLLLAASLGLSCALSAQEPQYRTADGRAFASLPDTGIVRAAARTYRRDRTLEHALALGAAQSSVREYRAALATYTDALKRWPEAALLYRWRGHRRLTLRDFIGARADLQTALQIDSTLYGAWYHLGIVDFINGHFRAAAAAFARAIPLAPDAGERAGSTDWLWQSLARRGDHAEADSLLRARPDSIPAGNAYAARLRLYRVEIGPDALIGPADTAGIQRATLSFGLGSWYLTKQDSAAASVWFRRAVAEGDGWPSFGFIAAEAQLAGRTEAPETAVGIVPDRCTAAIADETMQDRVITAVLSFDSTGAFASSATRLQMALLADDLARSFRAGFGVPSVVLPRGDERYGWQDLLASVRLVVRRDGTVSATTPGDAAVIGQKGRDLGRDLAAALPEALRETGWKLVFPDDTGSDSVVTHLSINHPLGAIPAGVVEVPPAGTFALFSLRTPDLRLIEPIPGTAPRYPDRARSAGIEATLLMRFIVDTAGRVVPASIQEHWPSALPRPRGEMLTYYESFREELVRVLPAHRYTPARVGGCTVRAVVQQPFIFALQR